VGNLTPIHVSKHFSWKEAVEGKKAGNCRTLSTTFVLYRRLSSVRLCSYFSCFRWVMPFRLNPDIQSIVLRTCLVLFAVPNS